MSKPFSRSILIAGLSAVVTAGVVSVSTPAFAADALRQHVVKFGDLDLATDQGARALDQRIKRASRAVCDTGGKDLTSLKLDTACRATAIASVQPKVEMALAAARSGKDYALNTVSVRTAR